MTNKYNKLIELLNEFELYNASWWTPDVWKFEWELHYYSGYLDECVFNNVKLRIISKSYGFIKRLVDNDKIDIIKMSDVFFKKTSGFNNAERVNCCQELLMLLAISDSPIQDLCVWLK